MTWLESGAWVVVPLVLAYAGCVLVTPEARRGRRLRRNARRNPQRASLDALERLWRGGERDA